MRVVLHIGSNKTGTTSLQRALHAGRDLLAREGILYPRSPDGSSTHALLLAGMYHPDHVPRLERQFPKSAAARAELVSRIREEVRSGRPGTLVLSSEGFFRPLAPGALERLEGELRGLGAASVEVAVYLRRPSEKYLSSLQQSIKASSRFPLPASSAYREVLEPYVAVFGAGSVKARRFDRATLAGGDITEDFCRWHLGSAGATLAGRLARFRSNATLSAESMDIVRRFREAFYPGEDGRFNSATNALVRALLRLDFLHGAPRPRLREAVAAGIDAASAADLRWVEEVLGLALPTSVDAGALPGATRLADLVTIKPDLRAALLRSLARSAWAFRPGWEGVRGGFDPGALFPRRNWCRRLAASGDGDNDASLP